MTFSLVLCIQVNRNQPFDFECRRKAVVVHREHVIGDVDALDCLKSIRNVNQLSGSKPCMLTLADRRSSPAC